MFTEMDCEMFFAGSGEGRGSVGTWIDGDDGGEKSKKKLSLTVMAEKSLCQSTAA